MDSFSRLNPDGLTGHGQDAAEMRTSFGSFVYNSLFYRALGFLVAVLLTFWLLTRVFF